MIRTKTDFFQWFLVATPSHFGVTLEAVHLTDTGYPKGMLRSAKKSRCF